MAILPIIYLFRAINMKKVEYLTFFIGKMCNSLSLRFSTRNIRRDDDLLNLPLYLADRISGVSTDFLTDMQREDTGVEGLQEEHHL